MDILEGIYSRRSVRSYRAEPVAREQVQEILRAGTWAPSGLNNQPWRFVVVRDRQLLGELAKLTRYSHIIAGAPVAIAVFCDRRVMYNSVKDHQGIGACLQNMLLAAHGLGLGAVWLGEILKSEAAVRQLLGLSDELELMAVVTVGHPVEENRQSSRKPLDELLIKEL